MGYYALQDASYASLCSVYEHLGCTGDMSKEHSTEGKMYNTALIYVMRKFICALFKCTTMKPCFHVYLIRFVHSDSPEDPYRKKNATGRLLFALVWYICGD